MAEQPTPPAGYVIRDLVDGPLDGQQVAVAPQETEFRYQLPDDDLERLLEASVAVQQGRLVALPVKIAVYRLVRLGEGKVVPLRPWVFKFEEYA